MSAEAPKGTVKKLTSAMVNSRKRFTDVLKRLFVIAPEPGSTQIPISKSIQLPTDVMTPELVSHQPKLKIIQPPVGLEDFDGKIQQEQNNILEDEKQKNLDRQNSAREYLATRAAEEAMAMQKQRRIEDQEKARITEATRVLDTFHIAERLKYIQESVWEGKGHINMLGSLFGGSRAGYWDPSWGSPASWIDVGADRLGGLELIYEYPSFTEETVSTGYETEDWWYKPCTIYTSLRISVVNLRIKYKEARQVLELSSSFGSSFSSGVVGHKILDMDIPIDSEDSDALLIKTLAQETAIRKHRESMPVQLEEGAAEDLARAKQSPHWLKRTSRRFTISD